MGHLAISFVSPSASCYVLLFVPSLKSLGCIWQVQHGFRPLVCSWGGWGTWLPFTTTNESWAHHIPLKLPLLCESYNTIFLRCWRANPCQASPDHWAFQSSSGGGCYYLRLHSPTVFPIVCIPFLYLNNSNLHWHRKELRKIISVAAFAVGGLSSHRPVFLPPHSLTINSHLCVSCRDGDSLLTAPAPFPFPGSISFCVYFWMAVHATIYFSFSASNLFLCCLLFYKEMYKTSGHGFFRQPSLRSCRSVCVRPVRTGDTGDSTLGLVHVASAPHWTTSKAYLYMFFFLFWNRVCPGTSYVAQVAFELVTPSCFGLSGIWDYRPEPALLWCLLVFINPWGSVHSSFSLCVIVWKFPLTCIYSHL